MNAVFQSLVERLRPLTRLLLLRWHASVLPRFFSWWGSELLACLPSSWQAAIKPAQQEQPLFSRDNAFWSGAPGRLQPLLEPVTPANGTPVLVLQQPQLLIHEVLLPVAAAQDLTSVLSFEMDKYTPFKASQVYFDFTREPSGHREPIRIRLAVVSRERLDAILDQAQQAGHSIAAVDAIDEHGVRLNINLLPSQRRPQVQRSWVRPVPTLALVALALMLTTMLLWLHNRQQALEDMQRQVKALQQQTQQVQALNQQINETLSAQRYVMEQRAQSTSMSALLNELTQCITLDTTLEYLSVGTDGQLSLSGESTQASALPTAMRSCNSLQGINFQGAIQADPVTGLERFTLLATLRKVEAGHAPATLPR